MSPSPPPSPPFVQAVLALGLLALKNFFLLLVNHCSVTVFFKNTSVANSPPVFHFSAFGLCPTGWSPAARCLETTLIWLFCLKQHMAVQICLALKTLTSWILRITLFLFWILRRSFKVTCSIIIYNYKLFIKKHFLSTCYKVGKAFWVPDTNRYKLGIFFLRCLFLLGWIGPRHKVLTVWNSRDRICWLNTIFRKTTTAQCGRDCAVARWLPYSSLFLRWQKCALRLECVADAAVRSSGAQRKEIC